MIISEKPDEVGDSIINHLNIISITFLYGEGGFLGERRLFIVLRAGFFYPN